MSSASIRMPVAVLGATGAVGQLLVERLTGHPWFELVAVAASDRTAGQPYRLARRGDLGRIPPEVLDWLVRPSDPEALEVPLVFSALDAESARTVEPRFAQAGAIVVSNASAFRLEPDVPLVIPEVNPDHLGVLESQRKRRGWPGAIICNPNCVATIVALALAPLQARYGVRRAIITTLQAISGAGHPGIPAWDIVGNVVPGIAGEAGKIREELPKLLGQGHEGGITPLEIGLSVQTNRVPVATGHMACLTVECAERPDAEAAARCLREWRGNGAAPTLPSQPEYPIDVISERNGPQPRRDLDRSGMRIAVGQIQLDPVFHLSFVTLGDNLVRGAAGAAILNAELYLKSRVASHESREESRIMSHES